ncbi:unnamed protein product [Eruca vesicaria subsp. sativa]|uniref:Uncharacterized protein n=1 Tax=Eruca vesicaria subsp. sativa TaxID=29727 RepID=A0ABC8J9U4_ERUVS|nr:unnamed protein product [Eruca vesicaria subsp. sativa]
MEVISDPIDEFNGLQLVSNLVEKKNMLGEEDVMDMEEIRACLLQKGIDMDSEEFLKENPEDDFEKMIKEQEEEEMAESEIHRATEEQKTAVETMEGVGGEQDKNQGTRRRLVKPAINTFGSNKMRTATALLSPRKRNMNKGGAKQGELKTLDGKGIPIPKAANSKT